MATQTKKKTTKPATRGTGRSNKAAAKTPDGSLFSSQAVQVLVFLFTILCVIFAVMAFNRYS